MAKKTKSEDAPYETTVSEQEKQLAKRLVKQIQDRLDSPEHKKYLKRIEINRLYAAGEQEDDQETEDGTREDNGLVRANLIHPELKKAQNECYAKNPDVDISPTESVKKDRYESWKAVGKTLEIVLRNQYAFSNGNIKARAKRAVRSADTAGIGWLKVIFQRHIERDPIIEGRMQDVQDNIQRIDRLMKEIGDDQEGPEDLDLKKEELEQELASLEAKVEVTRKFGLVFKVRLAQNIVYSEDVQDTDDIEEAEWLTDIIWMKVSRAKEMFKKDLKQADRYNSKKENTTKTSKDPDVSDDDMYIKVFEMWNKQQGRIYTLAEGCEYYLREPYSPEKVGERFHGLFPLIFDPVDGRPYPNPLTSQLIELQDEHNTARTNFREHRERAVPFNVAHGGQLDPTEVDKLTNPGFMETIVLKSAPEGQPLEAVFKAVQHPPIDPAVYSTEHVRMDWEQITRRGDAARGLVSKTKSATEAQNLQQNLQVDTSERKDVVEDWFHKISQYCLEILLMELSGDEVRRIAGEEAAWPTLSREEVFDMVQLKVRAGSSGKPNAALEMERWLKMLPQIKDALLAIVEMREAGKDKQAKILEKLLRETIDRFEERIDLDAFIPRDDEEEEPDPAKEAEIAQQQKMMALQMRDMVSTIANRDADTMKKVAEAENEEAGPQIQAYMAILQGLLNQQQQATAAAQQPQMTGASTNG